MATTLGEFILAHGDDIHQYFSDNICNDCLMCLGTNTADTTDFIDTTNTICRKNDNLALHMQSILRKIIPHDDDKSFIEYADLFGIAPDRDTLVCFILDRCNIFETKSQHFYDTEKSYIHYLHSIKNITTRYNFTIDKDIVWAILEQYTDGYEYDDNTPSGIHIINTLREYTIINEETATICRKKYNILLFVNHLADSFDVFHENIDYIPYLTSLLRAIDEFISTGENTKYCLTKVSATLADGQQPIEDIYLKMVLHSVTSSVKYLQEQIDDERHVLSALNAIKKSLEKYARY